MSVEETHDLKETLTVDVNIPGHDPRSATPLFEHTRKLLLERDGACWVCGAKEGEQGPLEAHHHPIERCFADMIDWNLVKQDALAGELGLTQKQRDAAKAFDWEGFMNKIPLDPYVFVDNMLVNGVLLDKAHHILTDEGIHALPFPTFLASKYGKSGYVFSKVEVIHHGDHQ